MIEFEYDYGNLAKFQKVKASGRDIALEELESIFEDQFCITDYSSLDSLTFEERFITFGMSNQNQVLTVIYVIREGKIRPFNVWKTKRAKLKQYYEERQKLEKGN
jgi:uncharacterized DUF497 family protein